MKNKYERSQLLLERARKVTPLGAQTYSKSYRYFCEGISPAFIDHGDGCYLWDVDGNKYIDFICALGPITVGYNNKTINDAVIKQLQKGVSFSQPSPLTLELAEELCKIVPCAEMIRFLKNGSDATFAAVKLARAYTGRDVVAVCGYHGMHDWYIGSTVNNLGIPKAVSNLTKTFEYNNITAVKDLFDTYKNQIAAVIIEPIQGNGPREGYLNELLAVVHSNNAVLIFDEVVSGFRYALGGASELYNVKPDMAAFGKGMGNGFAVSAVAGKRSIMELIETKGVFISTTFGDEAISMAAALATLQILKQPNTYEHIWRLGKQMLDGLVKLINSHQVGDVISVSGLPPHCGVLFEGKGALSYLDINSVYQQKMIENSILSVGINNINLSHTEKDIQAFLDAADQAMSDVRIAIEKDSVSALLKGGKVDPIFKRNIK